MIDMRKIYGCYSEYKLNRKNLKSTVDDLSVKLILSVLYNIIFVCFMILTFILFLREMCIPILTAFILEILLYTLTLRNTTVRVMKKYKGIKKEEQDIIKLNLISMFLFVISIIFILAFIVLISIRFMGVSMSIFKIALFVILVFCFRTAEDLQKIKNSKINIQSYKMAGLGEEEINYIVANSL